MMLKNRLRRLIELRGITQKELADAIDCFPHNVSAWVCGYRFPYLQYVVKIALIYGVSVDWLLGLSDDMVGKPNGAKDWRMYSEMDVESEGEINEDESYMEQSGDNDWSLSK